MADAEYFCPAKINLLLAVTGRRADGFHDLVSVVAPVDFGDTLTVASAAKIALTCDDLHLPVDGRNLVLKAARAFREASGWSGGAHFNLAKRIPLGAGLGGGSSDAAAALKALNHLAGEPLAPAALAKLAAEVGSDCALFLAGGPVIMRGRGERIEALPPEAATGLRGRRVLLFKPGFAIATPWAYGRLAAMVSGRPAASAARYFSSAAAESAVMELVQAASAGGSLDAGLFNSLELPAFQKFAALPVLLGQLRQRFGFAGRMSGSGSACFGFLSANAPLPEMISTIKAAWGESTWVIEARLA